ncbi:MAG: DUF3592 domain-containing protein, partial [Bacteroidota bacterium]
VVAIAVAVWSYTQQSKFLKTCIETTGKVVEIKEKYSKSSSTSKYTSSSKKRKYHPVIEFDTENGETVTFCNSTGSKSQNTYKIGQVFAILYDPADPENAKLKSDGNQNMAYLAGGAGLLFLIIGIITFFTRKKKLA